MIVIRPITQNDAEAFIDIAYHASIGMTSMPRNRELLQERVNDSERSFAKQILQPEDEKYLFVLEDTNTGAIGGTCGIIAKSKHETPLYFYRLEESTQPSAYPSAIPKTVPLMRVVHYYDSPSEICSLYLTPEFRRGGYGRLLSISRFLFIAAYPHRFDRILYASMRGHIDTNNISPFWEGIGRHFLDMEFETLMNLSDEDAINIPSALPAHPIYINLLPKDVQAAIGKTHAETYPALNMLMQEGFKLTDEIDVFDGGPNIAAEIQEIRAVKSSTVVRIAEITPKPLEGARYIISNNRLNFRACFSQIHHQGQQGIIIPAETATALQVHAGDMVRFVTPIAEMRGAGL